MMHILAVAGFILIFVSGLIDFTSLRPILEKGIAPVLRVAYSQTLYFPFGEVIVFAMIFPYTKNVKKTALIVFSAIMLNGINLMITMIVSIGVLGLSHVFKLKNPSPLVFPIGLVVLFYSLSLAQNYFEHVYEGLKTIPFTLHLPFQIVIPALLLVIAFLRN
ncbi:GerAB/ArcD/ProY family transporter [Priestia megaterium]|uniref:GerAB/ArcD/ProY family transporter n=1 Tax=Priestia megaterium TaxID=1404 RepID=UPI002499FEB7|nr:GerAB/ArcD/ProY family transporter [Priestia megaterium]MDI3093601.1 GerAB/ArcD/ProY family transporter [Priestia megaterium]